MNAAVITGASVGIGQAVAERFVAAGYVVHNISRRRSGLAGVLDHQVDLCDLAAARAVAQELAETLADARSLCLVHNAAVMPQDRVDALDATAMDACMRLNVVAPAVLTAGMRTAMRPGSSVIFIGSTLSEKAVPGRASYVASKHAVVGLMRAACQDLFGSGIHTACVCPGFTDTQMLRSAITSAEVEEALVSMVSFGRLIDPGEIAEVVYNAALAPVLNGAVLHANLGQRQS